MRDAKLKLFDDDKKNNLVILVFNRGELAFQNGLLIFESKYSRMDQVEFVEDSLQKI